MLGEQVLDMDLTCLGYSCMYILYYVFFILNCRVYATLLYVLGIPNCVVHDVLLIQEIK